MNEDLHSDNDDARDELLRIDTLLRELVGRTCTTPLLIGGMFVAFEEAQLKCSGPGLRREIATREELVRAIGTELDTVKLANQHLRDRLSGAQNTGKPSAKMTCAFPGCGEDSVVIEGQSKIPKCYAHTHLFAAGKSAAFEGAQRPNAMEKGFIAAIDQDVRLGRSSQEIRDEIIGRVGMMADARTPEMQARYDAAVAREGGAPDAVDSIAEAIYAVRAARKRRAATGKAISTAIEAHDTALERDKEAYDELQRAEQKLLDLIADGDEP